MLAMYARSIEKSTQIDTIEVFDQQTDHVEIIAGLKEHPTQTYGKIPTNINEVLKHHPDMKAFSDKYLSASDMFEGLKLKAQYPHIFTTVIVASSIIQTNADKTQLDRYSIQPSWITGKLVVVKEEVHLDALNKKATFLGRAVDEALAKKVLIPALISEYNHQEEGYEISPRAQKARRAIPAYDGKENLEDYLNQHFEALFFSEKPALFHVVHGVYGQEEQPFETWRLVRLAKSEPELETTYRALRENIASNVSTHLYKETLKALETQEKGNKVKALM